MKNFNTLLFCITISLMTFIGTVTAQDTGKDTKSTAHKQAQTVTVKTYTQWKQACLTYIKAYDEYKALVISLFSHLRTRKAENITFDLEEVTETAKDGSKKVLPKKSITVRNMLARSLGERLSSQEKNILADFSDSIKTFPISKAEFMQTRDAFVALYTQQLSDSKSWVNTVKNPSTALLKYQFKPYVQKRLVQTGATITVIGDLHGDAESLIHLLDNLKNKGLLDDAFKLTSNHYCIFLGDYTDRGPCGVEVLYALFRLKIANPEQVVLLRGNHEDIHINECPRFFGTELSNKFNLTSPEERQKALYNLYELLPVALYLGNTSNDYVLFTHGGLDVGFDPAPLLKAPAITTFMSIDTLNRAKALFELTPKKGSLRVNLDKTIIKDKRDNILPRFPHDLHFLWNDFNDGLSTSLNTAHDVGWGYGELLTHAVLKRDGIKALIRGHSHELTLTGGGLHQLYKGLVTTATSFRFHGSSEFFKQYSFITLQIKPTYANWQAFHEHDGVTTAIKLGNAQTHVPDLSKVNPKKSLFPAKKETLDALLKGELS